MKTVVPIHKKTPTAMGKQMIPMSQGLFLLFLDAILLTVSLITFPADSHL
jgi:hypothetical protein